MEAAARSINAERKGTVSCSGDSAKEGKELSDPVVVRVHGGGSADHAEYDVDAGAGNDAGSGEKGDRAAKDSLG